jgi:electron transfer flavoprotein beta subunit
LKEAAGDGEVVVISMGPEKAMDALRKALAMGADRAVLVTDDALRRRRPARNSACSCRRARAGGADLVLFGQQSADGDGACLWAAVAERCAAGDLAGQRADVEGTSVTGKRQTEFGYDTIRAPLPAVVAVSDAINEPRYPSLKGIMGAKKKPQETLSRSPTSAARRRRGGSRTTVLALAAARPGRGARIEDDGSAAEQIVAFLAEKRLI